MITNTDLLICKAITTESFPDRGWIGIVIPNGDGLTLVDVMTRGQMYAHVQKLMEIHGDRVVRLATNAFKVPTGHQLIFTKRGEANTLSEATQIIRTHLAANGK